MSKKSLLTRVKEAGDIVELAKVLEIDFGRVYIDISHRGGGIGFYGSDIALTLEIDEYSLPNLFGAGCNYLGGGMRGAIFASGYDESITGESAELLDAIANKCVEIYEDLENEDQMNEEIDEGGDINWDAKATNASRKAGVVSAY
jgi:hypothetical protein